ncbi:MAG: hypothetical protein H6Q52_826 [Deltaproteobacteria bacterium]|nr:hypothetical protein [Deltaproteobacteria bacterium]
MKCFIAHNSLHCTELKEKFTVLFACAYVYIQHDIILFGMFVPKIFCR